MPSSKRFSKPILRLSTIRIWVPFAALLWLFVRDSTPAAESITTPPLLGVGTSLPDLYPHTNRLILEKSPYLLQHAHNPVDWYPWGEQAFARARSENKPIFLSVGYSTCHWCHVMERESFENPDLARILNDGFVCIKVDREERPDVDQVYMTFVQATTGSGGWPMSVWLTPELKPFLGGTYFPPGQLKELMNRVTAAWHNEHDKIVSSGDSITRKLRVYASGDTQQPTDLNTALLDDCYSQLKSSYDSLYSGFGDAPKFPRPVVLNFLLRYYSLTGKADALEMSLETLRKMAAGGIHDQLGGGFHRYSTDTRWQVPHFEKMLYDQALLACSYLEAFQITHDGFFADSARDILRYVQRDLTGKEGQFYSAEDADSPVPGKPGAYAEGAFYVWDKAEIASVLESESAVIFDFYYGIEAQGNVRSDSSGELFGKNVLTATHTLDATAKKFKSSPDQIGLLLNRSRRLLYQTRARRPRSRLDDKTITAWNGLMISAFARAFQVLGDPAFLESAQRARTFLKSRCYDPKRDILFRRYRAGDRAIEGYADDYAFLIQGLLDLYESSFEIADLMWAMRLQNTQNQLFEDKEHGGFFNASAADPALLLRLKEDYDGAEPSANSISALNLLRLAQMTDNITWRRSAKGVLDCFASRLHGSPASMPQMLTALEFSLGKIRQIVIAGQLSDGGTQAMLRAAREPYLPDKVLLLADGADGQKLLAEHLEFLRGLQPLEHSATAYVCENYTCQLPTTNIITLREQLLRKQRP